MSLSKWISSVCLESVARNVGWEEVKAYFTVIRY